MKCKPTVRDEMPTSLWWTGSTNRADYAMDGFRVYFDVVDEWIGSLVCSCVVAVAACLLVCMPAYIVACLSQVHFATLSKCMSPFHCRSICLSRSGNCGVCLLSLWCTMMLVYPITPPVPCTPSPDCSFAFFQLFLHACLSWSVVYCRPIFCACGVARIAAMTQVRSAFAVRT